MLPVVLALEALGSPELSSGQQLALTLLWILSIGMVYAFWLFKRQERSEHRRAYRFREPNERNDLEVAGAKKVLLAPASTETDRESAWELLISRCACTPYHVSFVRDAVRWIGAFLVVGLIFFIILWLF